ncbi:MAG: hypothetical protein HY550_09120 [Elusimicrobia bacterium]|nr:hypothetical protein [Elusimicrobiota bacterium]
MRKSYLLLLLPFAAACSGKLPEQEVLKIFSRHSYEEHSPQRLSGLLKEKGAGGLRDLDRRALVLKARRPVKARGPGISVCSGLLVGLRPDGLCILKVFKDSPGAAAGLRDGDRVLELDGEPASPDAALRRLSGSAGFTLKVGRPGAAGPFEAKVSREDFFFPPNFGFYDRRTRTAFLRLGLFFEGSAAPVLDGLDAMRRLGAANLILDLRDNPGGVPAEAAEMLKAFAPKAGRVLEVRSRHKGYSALYEAAGKGRFAGLRTAVLVNSGTSMAAEVFARSLKEISGTVLVGETTAGSVSLVRAFSLGDGRGLELTVAKLFPPSGLDMEGKGAEPDLKAGGKIPGRVWDDSRETALLGDEAYAAAGLFAAGKAP